MYVRSIWTVWMAWPLTQRTHVTAGTLVTYPVHFRADLSVPLKINLRYMAISRPFAMEQWRRPRRALVRGVVTKGLWIATASFGTDAALLLVCIFRASSLSFN